VDQPNQEDKRRRRREADKVRQQKKRAKLREANVKTIHCHLQTSVVNRLQHFAVLYEASSKVAFPNKEAALGGEGANIGIGKYLGLLLEDILDGPVKSPMVWRALRDMWEVGNHDGALRGEALLTGQSAAAGAAT
jgi:hypothetical protein